MTTSNHERILTNDQIETFRKDGILVVDNIFTDDELISAQRGLRKTLLHYGVDDDNLMETAHNLQQLSSTNGSGGVLDIFYPHFKMDISCNERLFRATTELWSSGACKLLMCRVVSEIWLLAHLKLDAS